MKYSIRNSNTKEILVVNEAQLAFFKTLCEKKYLVQNDWTVSEIETIHDCTDYVGGR